MVAFRNLRGAWRTFPFLVPFAILALPLQHRSEGLATSSGILFIAPIKIKTALPQQVDKVEIAALRGWPAQTPKIHPSLLRIDFKQNLLVWPNIANDLTRSPPFPAPVRSFS
jgi:hypothetical protein